MLNEELQKIRPTHVSLRRWRAKPLYPAKLTATLETTGMSTHGARIPAASAAADIRKPTANNVLLFHCEPLHGATPAATNLR